MGLLLVEVLIFVISSIIAKVMVKKRRFLAKRVVIGKDDEETKTHLLDIAQMINTQREVHILPTCEECTITITGKEREITSIKVENERTMIHKTFEKGCSSSRTIDKGFSECGATFFVASEVWACLNMFVFIIGLIGLL